MVITLLHQLTNVPWVAMTFSGLVGSLVVSRLLKGDPARDLIRDTLLKSGLIALAFWKLSSLLLQPTLLLDKTVNLFTFLLSSGTEEGLYLGVVAGTWFVLYQLRKGHIPAVKLAEVFPFGVLTGFMVYSLLNRSVGTVTEMPWGVAVGQSAFRYHPIAVYQLLFGMIVGSYMFWVRKRGKSISFASFLLLFSLFQMALTFFQYTKPFYLGLSLQQLFFVGVAIFTVMFAKIGEKKQP